MEIIQHSNGPEEAKNSSTQHNVGIQLPANNSYQQSLYIAAISKSLGHEGLISPVTEIRHGVEHKFDFYDPEAEQLFNVLGTFKEDEYARYSKYYSRPFVILDSAAITHEMKDCECGCEYMQVRPQTAAASFAQGATAASDTPSSSIPVEADDPLRR